MDLIPLTSKRSRARGFTLAEYLVATSIGLLALGAALVLWAYASKTCATLFAYVDLSSTSKNAVNRLSQQIRNAKRVESCSPSMLVLIDSDGQRNILAYSASQKKLSMTKSNVMTILLTECTNFQFSVYNRVPSNSNFGLNRTWTTNEAKVVQMQWTCVRRITGDKSSVESQVSSKVVIRNQ